MPFFFSFSGNRFFRFLLPFFLKIESENDYENVNRSVKDLRAQNEMEKNALLPKKMLRQFVAGLVVVESGWFNLHGRAPRVANVRRFHANEPLLGTPGAQIQKLKFTNKKTKSN